MSVPNLNITHLTTIISAALTMELMERLQHTNVYRHEIKRTGSAFYKELEKITTKEIGKIWGMDDVALYKMLDYQREIIEHLCTIRPEDFGIISLLINSYKEHPARTLKRMQIKLVESSNLPDGND